MKRNVSAMVEEAGLKNASLGKTGCYLAMHTQLTFELASSDGQIPAVYQRALQLGKNKELATTLAERRLKISRENFQHLYELLSLDSIVC